jgi:integrase
VNGWDGEFGDFKLSRLTTPICEAFRLYLLTDKKWIRGRKTDKTISHRTDKTISRRTAQDILTSFKGMLNEAQRQGLIDYNPALPVHISTKTREQARIRIGEQIPDRPEVRDALDALTGRWYKIFMTDAFTGMRSSELRGLAWPGVKLETLKIEVYQRANMSGKIGPCKSKAGYREISIPLILADELRRWKLICPPSPENLVFPDDDGNVISRFIIRYEWQAVQRRIKMIRSDKKAKYNVHALRHFFASIMIAEGTPPKRLQELLGHATLAMTMDLYGHLFPAGEAEAARANSAAARVLAD